MAAPGGTGPVGPYPPGVETDDDKVEYDKLRRRVLWIDALRASTSSAAAPVIAATA